jgi:hypothetical protein
MALVGFQQSLTTKMTFSSTLYGVRPFTGSLHKDRASLMQPVGFLTYKDAKQIQA